MKFWAMAARLSRTGAGESKRVRWALPRYEDEAGEFARYPGLTDSDLEAIRAQFVPANVENLTDDVWSELGNTDSYDVHNMEEVRILATKYGKDYGSIIDGIENGEAVPAPIVMVRDGAYELVAGNTRLMVSRALGIQPKVLVIHV